MSNDPVLVGREWHFADGTVLPLISGGSDTGPTINPQTGDLTPAAEDQGGQSGTDIYGAGQNPDTLANPYLSKIPEADRAVVGKYVNEWDKGVQARFRAIHDQYAPFKGVDPEQFRQSQAVYQLLDSNPEQLFKLLADNLGYELGESGPPQQQEFENPWAEDGIPDSFAQALVEMQNVNQALVERVMGYDNDRVEQEEDAELDEVLDSLHQRHGDFNDDFVMMKIAQGEDPEAAIASWNETLQAAINSQRSPKPPVPVLGGNGSIPVGGVDPRKASGEDVRKMIAQGLANLQQEA